MTYIFFYFSVIILFTLAVKIDARCSISYEYINGSKQCIVTCTDSVDNNQLALFNQHGYRQYGYDMKCRDPDSHLFIKALIYKSNITSSPIPLVTGPDVENVIDAIYSLDLSDNSYENTPSIMSMDHLHVLNISRNHLTTAVLSNDYKLDMLTELDLSYNMINDTKANKHQYIYQKLQKLDISHNNIKEIPNATFESFDDLQVLNLSYNRINKISPDTFEGLRKLIELNLSNNRLTSINTSLFRFSKLEILNLSGNLICNLQPNDFEHLSKLQTLDLSFNILKEIDLNVFNVTTLLEALNLKNNLLQTLDEDNFSNLQLLTNIDLSNNEIKSIPINLFKNNNISYFSISANRLEGSLIRGMFEGVSTSRLDLSYQYLTEVKDYAFEDLDELQEIFLNFNNIKYLSNNSFKTLKNLNHLDLSNNRLKSINFDKTDLMLLRSLIIKNNFLTVIKYEEIEFLNNLERLDISNNKISQLKPNLFHSLKNLINLKINNPLSGVLATGTFNGLILLPRLDISHTMINIIQNASFTNMAKLKEVNMTNCKISELQYNVFIHTGHIEILDLSYNKLNDFAINATELSRLTLLLLNNNFIKTISFENIAQLRKIILSHNNLENISNETFYRQIHLSYLDLSYNEKLNFIVWQKNKLTTLIVSGLRIDINFKPVMNYITDLVISNASVYNISQLSITKMISLTTLDVSFNYISKLQSGDFDNLHNLEHLDLSFNRISNIQADVFTNNINLLSLNISHNSIPFIRHGTFLGLETRLAVLDISYNKLTELEIDYIYDFDGLTDLIVDFNQIIEVKNIDDLLGTSFSSLSIGDNPLPCEALVKLNKQAETFQITALRLDEHNKENVNGVVCNTNRNIEPIPIHKGDSKNDDTLDNIRNILESLSNKNTEKDASDIKYLEKISNTLGKLSEVLINNINQSIDNNNSTNIMLNKLTTSKENLAITTKNVVPIPKPPVAYATTFEALAEDNFNVTPTIDIISYISHVKGELENAMAIEKQNTINQIERKLASSGNRTETAPIGVDHENLVSSGNDKKKHLYAVTYVALTLSISLVFIFIGFMLYRLLYK